MKRLLFGITTVILVLNLCSGGMVFVPEATAAGKRVIVVFDAASSPAERRVVVQQEDSTIIKELSIVSAIVIQLPEEASERAKEAILRYASVVRVEDDLIVNASQKPEEIGGGKPTKPDPPPPPKETLPWGVDRIDAEFAWINTTGVGVKTAILDTGIDVDHPDLANNLAGGVNIINPKRLFDDDNGHGTHVAGIVAAVDNEVGVIGTAKQASLYGVKVLDRTGSGWMSDIIAGLEWCINNRMDIVNMSLGASSYSQVFQEAITAVYKAGIVQIAAAGNDGGPVSYPAAYTEVVAVSATDNWDYIPSWSNFGPEIDLCAPGVAVYSTYKGGGYKELSGTSMAAPHVTGVAALILENQPAYTPDQVLQVLTSTADNLGYSAEKQGSGLVDAEQAAFVTE
ncbi:MAG: S8 family peptidase [Candidatus Desantisbacteria bacterium]